MEGFSTLKLDPSLHHIDQKDSLWLPINKKEQETLRNLKALHLSSSLVTRLNSSIR